MSLRIDPFAYGRSISRVEADLRRFGGQFPHLYSVPDSPDYSELQTPLAGPALFTTPGLEIYESRDGVYRITVSEDYGAYLVGVKNLKTGSFSSSRVADHSEALDRLFHFFADKDIDFVKVNPLLAGGWWVGGYE